VGEDGRWQDIITSECTTEWLMITGALSPFTTPCLYRAKNSADVVAVSVFAVAISSVDRRS
jgi:hypothetical protein